MSHARKIVRTRVEMRDLREGFIEIGVKNRV